MHLIMEQIKPHMWQRLIAAVHVDSNRIKAILHLLFNEMVGHFDLSAFVNCYTFRTVNKGIRVEASCHFIEQRGRSARDPV